MKVPACILRDVVHDSPGHLWSAPAVVAAITGLTSRQASALLRRTFRNPAVWGASAHSVRGAMAKAGWLVGDGGGNGGRAEGMPLADWVASRKALLRSRPAVLSVRDGPGSVHWVAAHQGWTVESASGGVVLEAHAAPSSAHAVEGWISFAPTSGVGARGFECDYASARKSLNKLVEEYALSLEVFARGWSVDAPSLEPGEDPFEHSLEVDVFGARERAELYAQILRVMEEEAQPRALSERMRAQSAGIGIERHYDAFEVSCPAVKNDPFGAYRFAATWSDVMQRVEAYKSFLASGGVAKGKVDV